VKANEVLRDEEIAHNEALQRYANGVVRRVIALLNLADADISAAMQGALERMTPSTFNVERLDALLASVRALNTRAMIAAGDELAAQMRELVSAEADFQIELFEKVIPAQVQASVAVAQVEAGQVYTAALSRPFQGRLLREWMGSIDDQRAARIRDAVRIGYVQNETIDQIVRRIRGSRSNGYADGLLEIDRRAAEAVVRTAVAHFAGFTRDRFLAANDDLVASLSWTATLDTRTSPICRVRDGKRYGADEKHRPIGHSLPWLGGPGLAHWACRSTSVPVLKSWRELGIDADDVDAETRSSMDGQVPADTTFGEWLKRQSAARQDDVLGPTRGALFRKGDIPIERFYNDKGRYLSIEELRSVK
jgi:SPP1 gp7 family putative phage head morphogenesis protein